LAAIGAMLISTLTVACSDSPLAPLQFAVRAQKPSMVTIKIDSYCPNRFVDFFAKPLSYVIDKDGAMAPDSNRDGLADVEAVALGLNPTNQPPSGITDFIATQFLGLNAQSVATIPTCLNTILATAGDVLTDCQRSALGLNIANYDTVGRGFPDSLALFARLPLLDKNVANEETAGDHLTTLAKIRQNLPINQTATETIQMYAVQITTDTHISATNADSICYDFTTVAPRTLAPVGDLYVFYFISTDAKGATSLVTKSVVVPANAAANQEYSYANL
jgi:hypothetical protein